MATKRLTGVLAFLVLVGLAACDRPGGAADDDAYAGEQALMPGQAMDPEVMAQVMEIQQLQAQLEPIQREALEDETLARQLEALQLQVEMAMREEGAEIFSRIERFQGDMAAAEAAGDQERMQALATQAQGIEQEFHALQVAMFQRPEIREPFDRFEAAHRARMIEIDPSSSALLDRIEELMDGLPD
jgi:TolA-binding protein